jgi:hypothetical protein
MSKPFAYNPSGVTVSGTIQVGSVSVGYPTAGFGGTQWWNGPDEGTGYVIAIPTPLGNQDTPVFTNSPLTLSTTYLGNSMNLSNGNQTVHQFFGYVQTVLGDSLVDNKDRVMFSFLCELAAPSTFPGGHFVGFGTRSMNYNLVSPDLYSSFPGNDNQSVGFNSGGEYWFNGSVQVSGLPTWSHNDIIDVAVDMQSEYVWVRVNGGSWNNNPSENPTTSVGSLGFGGLKSFYPALCPAYEGTYTIQNTATYGIPSGFKLLGYNLSASVGFLRSSALTDGSFISLANYVSARYNSGTTFSAALSAKTWLNNNGYWTSYGEFSSSITIATNAGGGLTGFNVGGQAVAFAILSNPAIGTTYPVGSTIIFQNGESRTFVGYDDYGAQYDVFYDSPISTGTLFPITIGIY